MASTRITSRQHAFVRRCRRLAVRRSETADVLLDGEHLVAEALSAGLPLEGLLTDDRPHPIVARARARAVPLYTGPVSVVAAASPAATTSGVVAIARWMPAPLAAVLQGTDAVILGLVGVQDPGNVGAAIRSADALGATGVLALDGTAHPGGWKALRGAMGSTFRIPVGTGRLDEAVSLARRHRIRVAATVAAGGVPLDDAPLAAPLLLLLGNEGAGLPAAAVAAADLRLTIPMRPGVNSLNVGIAAAVLLWSLRARHGRPAGEAAR